MDRPLVTLHHTGEEPSGRQHNRGVGVLKGVVEQWFDQEALE
jgi:hypothetical protein